VNKPASLVIILALSSALAGLGCDKGGASGASGAAGAAGATTMPPPSGPASAAGSAHGALPSGSGSAAPAASAPAEPAGAAGSWKGTYTAKVAEVTPPKDAQVKLWAKDPGTAAVGDGTLKLTLTGSGTKLLVKGEAKGPLGAQVISGDADGKDISARVDPKDPNAPDAMTGFFQGKLEGSSIVGTLRVSSRNGNLAREAEIKLTRGELASEESIGHRGVAAGNERGAAPAPPAGRCPCTPAGRCPCTPAGRCPCTPAKRKGACRPFSLGNLSSGLCDNARRSVGPHAPWEAPRSRACPTACAPVAAQSCSPDDTVGARGSAGSQRCTRGHKGGPYGPLGSAGSLAHLCIG
jgi:hypothetical protein